jgi:hypothetical protein
MGRFNLKSHTHCHIYRQVVLLYMCSYIKKCSQGSYTRPLKDGEQTECSPDVLIHTEPPQPHTYAKSGRPRHQSDDVRSRSCWSSTLHCIPTSLVKASAAFIQSPSIIRGVLTRERILLYPSTATSRLCFFVNMFSQ